MFRYTTSLALFGPFLALFLAHCYLFLENFFCCHDYGPNQQSVWQTPLHKVIFLQLSFYILHFAPHFCVGDGDNESAHAEIELWRNNCRLQMLAQKSFFSSGSQEQIQFATKSNLNIISAHKWQQYNNHPGDHPLVSDDSADLSIFFLPKMREGRRSDRRTNLGRGLKNAQFLPPRLMRKRPHALMSNV